MPKHSPQNQPRKGKGVCTYCGKERTLTADHVFPQSLFIELDEKMLTVPACGDCQRTKGLGDADLEIFANLHIMGSTHPDSIKHIEKVTKRNENTEQFLIKMMATSEIRSIETQSGTHIADAFIANYNSSRIINSLTMVARGLRYNSTGTVLDPEIDCFAQIVPWTAFYSLIRVLAPYRKGELEIKGNNVVWWSEISIEVGSQADSFYVACINDKILILLATGEFATKLRERINEIELTKMRNIAVMKYQPSNITLHPDQLPDSQVTD